MKKSAWRIFLDFLRIGCFTFGGGWSIVAQMQEQFVEKEKLITNEELIELTSVGRSIPGAMVTNTSMLFGYHVCGIPGGFAAVAGLVLSPILILCVITLCYGAVINNPYIASAVSGIRAAVVPIIACAVTKMVKGSYKYKLCFAVTVVCFTLYLFFNVNSVYLVVFGVLSGLAIGAMRGEEKQNDTP